MFQSCSEESNKSADYLGQYLQVCSRNSPQGEVTVDDLQVLGGLCGWEAIGEGSREGKDDSGCSLECRHGEL
jgi:hypothetical protein